MQQRTLRAEPFDRPPQLATEVAFDLLAQAILDQRFCLVVGAGASADVGAANWQEIVTRFGERKGLFHGCEVDSGYVCKVQSLTPDARSQRRDALIRSTLVGSGDDLPWLYEILEAFDSLGQQGLGELLYVDRVATSEWVRQPAFLQSAPFFLAVLAIISAWLNEEGTFHVISYNCDLLLEEAIEALGHCARTWASGTDSFDRLCEMSAPPHRVRRLGAPSRRKVEVRVLHPHGYVTREGRQENPVLTAAAYDWLASSSLEGASIRQIHAFGALTCLFYGFSFRDYNVRRLLRVSHPQPASGVAARHIALLVGPTADSSRDGCIPDASLYPARRRIDHFQAVLLRRQFGIDRFGNYSFVQHKRFVMELLRYLNHHRMREFGRRFDWPL